MLQLARRVTRHAPWFRHVKFLGSTAVSRKETVLPNYPSAKHFRLTEPPNTEWSIGDGANTLASDTTATIFRTIDFSGTVQPKNGYKLLTSAIVPRPIAFVSSISVDGVPNLAPFSYFSMVSHNPPLLSVSFSLSPRRPKDTRENILATKKFTVNIVSDHFIEAANSTSLEAPADVNEWILFFHNDIPIGEDDPTIGTTLVLGRIKTAHVREAVLSEDEETIDAQKLRAVARLGGLAYATVGHGFDLPRPSWKKSMDLYNGLVARRTKEDTEVDS
ncbi:hypothetical protein ONZ45_g11133 [Pleurotus djamor]|nr:hypothetical protein ONZ45_g11133 [Pleurotus djamor]